MLLSKHTRAHYSCSWLSDGSVESCQRSACTCAHVHIRIRGHAQTPAISHACRESGGNMSICCCDWQDLSQIFPVQPAEGARRVRHTNTYTNMLPKNQGRINQLLQQTKVLRVLGQRDNLIKTEASLSCFLQQKHDLNRVVIFFQN